MNSIDKKRMTKASKLLGRLSRRLRIELLNHLLEQDEPVLFQDLVDWTGVKQTNYTEVSQALGDLCRMGLVRREKEGRFRTYTARPKRCRQIVQAIDQFLEEYEEEETTTEASYAATAT